MSFGECPVHAHNYAFSSVNFSTKVGDTHDLLLLSLRINVIQVLHRILTRTDC